MNVSGTVTDSATGNAVVDARITVVVGDTELAVLYSDGAGSFTYTDSSDRVGQTVLFRVSRDGFQDQEVVYHVDTNSLALEVELVSQGQTWEPRIPLWLGLGSRRRLLLIGSIAYVAVLLVLSVVAAVNPNLGSVLLLILVFFSLVPAYAITTAALVKGFLMPIINGVTASVLFFVVVAASNNDAGEAIGPSFVMLLAHLVVGAGVVLLARGVWKPETQPDDR